MNKSALQMSERMEAEKLRLYVSRDIKFLEKIFGLRAKDGRNRVVTGSANMSASAFCGIQRVNIIYYDDEEACKWYKDSFDSFKAECSDNVNQTVMMRTMEDDVIIGKNIVTMIEELINKCEPASSKARIYFCTKR